MRSLVFAYKGVLFDVLHFDVLVDTCDVPRLLKLRRFSLESHPSSPASM